MGSPSTLPSASCSSQRWSLVLASVLGLGLSWWRATTAITSTTRGTFHHRPSQQPCITAVQVTVPDDASYQQAFARITEAYYPTAKAEEKGVAHNSTTPNKQSLSQHWFVRQAPTHIQRAVRTLARDSRVVQHAIRTALESSSSFRNNNVHSNQQQQYLYLPDAFDEIYLQRPEFDWVDTYKRHFDGNLKLPTSVVPVCTIRVLTYVAGPPATLVAVTSGTKAITLNSTMVLLDFNRELHYANTSSSMTSPSSSSSTQLPARLMLKTAIHVVRPGTWFITAMSYVAVHRIIFFVIKSVRSLVESTSSSGTGDNSNDNAWFLVGLMMLLDNGMRSLNKLHMALPLLCVGTPLVVVLLAPFWEPKQFVSYLTHMTVLMRVVAGNGAKLTLSSTTGTANTAVLLWWSVLAVRLWERYCLHRRLFLSDDHDTPTMILTKRLGTAWMIVCFSLQISVTFMESGSSLTYVTSLAQIATVEMIGLGLLLTILLSSWVGEPRSLTACSGRGGKTTTFVTERSSPPNGILHHFPLVLLHVAWAWLTVYVARNADMARDILFAPMEKIVFEETW